MAIDDMFKGIRRDIGRKISGDRDEERRYRDRDDDDEERRYRDRDDDDDDDD